ncbi:MAG: DUF2897 family protein [Gammaproteobacteria bacterium]
MLKAILIIVLAVGAIVGGLLTLRNSGRSGMPNDEVLKRATKHARELDAEDGDEEGRSGK